ncbi:hypothetical protein [Dactylosporangium sp. CA-233914]|uniref:hypothetical protein n=1 Tax=Dactylosporangium sp. CA-233914 TaxID=3239934 RepID=UPI003D93C857
MRHTLRRAAWFLAAWLALTAAAYWIAAAALPGRSPVAGPDGVPARIDAPWLWTPTVAQAPIGPVPIAAAGPTTTLGDLLTGNESVVVFADATGRQRTLDVPYIGSAIPGETLLLSPDGTRAAYTVLQGIGIVVQDLTTGAARTVPGTGEQATRPIAWAPDQRSLIVERSRAEDAGSLGSLDVGTGEFVPLLDTGASQLLVAAFRPDGTVAVQAGDQVCVFTGRRRDSCFHPPAGARLAGKGAWTPDGRSLALVTDHGRASELSLVAPSTGAPVDGGAVRGFPGVTTLLLLGWAPGDRAIVVAYHPEPDAPAGFDPADVDRLPTHFDFVRGVSVVALGPDGQADELVALSGAFLSVDVADAALASTAVRPVGPPPAWPARPALVAAAIALATGPLLVWSVRPRRGPVAQPGTAAEMASGSSRG